MCSAPIFDILRLTKIMFAKFIFINLVLVSILPENIDSTRHWEAPFPSIRAALLTPLGSRGSHLYFQSVYILYTGEILKITVFDLQTSRKNL